jgi:hypothetical protein
MDIIKFEHSGANPFVLTVIRNLNAPCGKKRIAECVDVISRGRYGEQRTSKVKVIFDE